jgi:tRNA G18 (ribose-2'-O)-methylase SpoU
VDRASLISRDARFQQWLALATNRNKRQRSGEFLVQGVRPITLAVEHHWPLRALLFRDGGGLSTWARGIVQRTAGVTVATASELLQELGGKSEEIPELVAVAALPADDLARISVGPRFLGVVLDRPASPGNIGTVVRSADAFGAAGVIVTGHAADPYDPQAVRASTGSLFAVPVVRTPGPAEVLAWARGAGVAVIGTDEHGSVELAAHDLTRPTLVLIGNETAGLSAAWREACDALVRIPIGGAASSLNAAAAATVVLYEAARQRRAQVAKG